MLVIGAAFYLVAFSTVRLVGDALFSDAIRSHAAQTQNLAAALGEKLGNRGILTLIIRGLDI